MKHKILTLLFAIVASVSSLFAQSGTCDDNLTGNLADVWKKFGNTLPASGGDTPSPAGDRTGQSTEGKDFWVTFMQADQDPNNELVLSLSISSREDCQVTISNPYTGYSEFVDILANQVQFVELYRGNVLLDNARLAMAQTRKVCYAGYSEQVDTCALHVIATKNISLFATNYKRATFDATNVLPTPMLQDEYIIQTYTPSDHGGVSQSQGSHFAIITAEDNTIVDYCPTVLTKTANDSVNIAKAKIDFFGGDTSLLTERDIYWLNYTVGDTLQSPVLMAGQVYYVWTGKKDNDAGDLSGTYVKARDGKKIAVFQGNPHTNIPYQVKQRDQLYSQAMPVRYWGNTFALTTSAQRPSDIIRVMAVHDGTEVKINGELVHTFDFSVDTKHFWEFEMGASGTYAQDGSCMLTTSCPVAVHLFLTSQRHHGDKNSNGDPAMLWISPVDQQMDQVTFATYESATGGMTSYVNVVTDRPELMMLDNNSIALDFSPVSGTNTYYYARIPLSYASHTLKSNGSRFNAHVYGFNGNESYAYSAGSYIEALSIPIYINGEIFRPEVDMTICGNGAIRFTCQPSYEFERIEWDFGDGTPVVTISDTATVVTHEYANNGTYNASVTIYRNSTNLCVGQMAMDIILIKVDISHPYDIQFGQTDIPCPERDVQKTALIPFTSNYDLNSENVTLRFDDVARAAGFIDSTLVVGEKELEFVVPSAADIDEVYSIYIEILSKCSDTVISVPFRLPISGDILEQRGNELIISENHPAISGAVLSDFHWYRKSDSTVVEGQTSSSLSATVLSEGEIANEAYYVCFALSKGQTHQSYTCTCAKYFEEGSANALDNTHTSFSSTLPKKILRNGQIFIQRGEKIYTITGQEIQSY